MFSGNIVKIQRFSIQDGPGIRTTVFLKGCRLRCRWCSNPESQNPYPELMYNSLKCVKNCQECLHVCQYIRKSKGNETIEIDRSRCTNCGKCAEVCYAKALSMVGESISTEKLIREVVRDVHFYQNSGGGITLSGGEPLYQFDFVSEILRGCKEKDLHIAVDTSGYSKWEKLREIAKYADLLLYDIKCMNNMVHKEFTGVGNKLILDNALKLSKENIPMIIRVPVIPGINNTKKEIEQLVRFVTSLNSVLRVELLPYHRLGVAKYKALGREYLMIDLTPPNKDCIDEISSLLKSTGIDTTIIT